MINLGYLIAAYTIIWVAVFGYIFALARKLRKVAREVNMLREMRGSR